MAYVICFLVLFLNLAFASFKPLDAELSDYKYPFTVKFHQVKSKDEQLKMAYMDLKPANGNGHSVLLLHGKNFSGAYWKDTAKDLLALKYRVIIPDQIGFGKSSKPKSFPYSFHYLSELTQELLQKLKVQNVIVIGHSMGGMLATRFALMYPQKVEKLVLVNPIGLEDWKTLVPYKNVNDIYQAELKLDENIIRQYQKDSYFDGKWSKAYEKGIEILVGWTLHKDYPRVAWNSALTADMIFTEPVLYEFKDLKMPTLLLLGTRDRTALGKAWADPSILPELGRYDRLGKKVVKLIPKGQLIELPGIGHMPQVEAYDLYWKELKAFLQK